jgi:hypothetical protein
VPGRPIGRWSRRTRAPQASATRRDWKSCRAAFAACQRGSRHRGRASPSGRAGSRCLREVVVLAGRATRVPQAAGTSGIQRIVTVTRRRPLGWAHAPDLGWGRGRNCMQGVIAVSKARMLALVWAMAPAAMAAATAMPGWAASSGLPPPAARHQACPGRAGRAGGC